MWMLMWMVGSTQAELPLADYGRELGIARWYEVEELFRVACTRHPQTGAYLVCDDEDALRAVIRHADAFQDVVQHTAGLEYQAGLAYRLLDEPAHAKTRFRASL